MAKVPTGFGFDMSGWKRKVGGARMALNSRIIPACVEKAMDMMNEEVTKNLNGIMHSYGTASPTPGQLPVTGITANLRGSVVSRRLNDNLGIVFVDGKFPNKGKAPYAIKVHDGVKKKGGSGFAMRPRRFFREARLSVKPRILAFWQAQLKLIGKL